MEAPICKADLHIHTTHSDGAATVSELLGHVARDTDLHAIAITDHDTITGAQQAARLARQFGIEVIIGEEVSTADGHLLALFIDSVLPPGHSATETIAAIHAQGGLAIAPHPFDRSVPSLGRAGCLREEWKFDAIEGFNAGVIWSQRGCNTAALRAAADRHLPSVGGSDAHTLATVGTGYTRFTGTSANDLYHAIQGSTVSCDGHYWSMVQYLDMGRQLIRQRSLRGAFGLAIAGAVIAISAIAIRATNTTSECAVATAAEPPRWGDALGLAIPTTINGWRTLRHHRPKPRSFTPETPGLSYWHRTWCPTTLMLAPMPRGCGAQTGTP